MEACVMMKVKKGSKKVMKKINITAYAVLDI